MALAFTSTSDYRDVWGTRLVRGGRITLDNAYPNGGTKPTSGWAITATQLGFSGGNLVWVFVPGSLDGYALEWDQVNGRLHVFQEAAAANPAAELANASTAMNAKVLPFLAIATGAHT